MKSLEMDIYIVGLGLMKKLWVDGDCRHFPKMTVAARSEGTSECISSERVWTLNRAEVKKRRMKLGAEDGRKSGVRDRLAVCEWVSEEPGEEGHPRGEKKKTCIFENNPWNITNRNFELFPRHGSGLLFWSRLCVAAGEYKIYEGIN